MRKTLGSIPITRKIEMSECAWVGGRRKAVQRGVNVCYNLETKERFRRKNGQKYQGTIFKITNQYDSIDSN